MMKKLMIKLFMFLFGIKNEEAVKPTIRTDEEIMDACYWELTEFEKSRRDTLNTEYQIKNIKMEGAAYAARIQVKIDNFEIQEKLDALRHTGDVEETKRDIELEKLNIELAKLEQESANIRSKERVNRELNFLKIAKEEAKIKADNADSDDVKIAKAIGTVHDSNMLHDYKPVEVNKPSRGIGGSLYDRGAMPNDSYSSTRFASLGLHL